MAQETVEALALDQVPDMRLAGGFTKRELRATQVGDQALEPTSGLRLALLWNDKGSNDNNQAAQTPKYHLLRPMLLNIELSPLSHSPPTW